MVELLKWYSMDWLPLYRGSHVRFNCFYCTTKVIVELVKQQAGIGFNSPPPFFLVVTGSSPLAVVVRELDATKKELYQLAL